MARQASDENDHIRVDEPDTELDAGLGDDTVFVTASGAVVLGGAGDDWLTTTIDFVRELSTIDDDGEEREDAVRDLTTELRGDAGDDHLHASIRGRHDHFGDPLNLIAKVQGGEGDDVLWVDLAGTGGRAEASVDAGLGNDVVRVNTMTVEDYFGLSGPITVEAGDGDDYISIFADGGGTDYIGGGNSATVYGGDGDDRIETHLNYWNWDDGGTTNTLYGGAGDDVVVATAEGGADFGSSSNSARGGDGDDEIAVTALGTAGEYASMSNEVYGDAGDDAIVARATAVSTMLRTTEGSNWISGGAGADTVSAGLELLGYGSGSNEVHGGSGDDRLSVALTFALNDGNESLARMGTNILQGGEGDDRLSAVITLEGEREDGADIHSELAGGEGADRLSVQGGDGNILEGNQDDDTLLGGSGDDRLVGGVGDDLLRGRGGDDTFVFGSIRGGERDRVLGFAIGEDLIDISRVDAKSWRSGNQSFTFDDSGEGGSGRVWVEEDPDGHGSLVHADNGRGVLVVSLLDGRSVDAGDYSAGDFLL